MAAHRHANHVRLHDGHSLEEVGRIDLPFAAGAMSFMPGSDLIVVAGAERFVLLDTKQRSIVESVSTLGDDVRGLATARGGRLFLLHASGRVSGWRIAKSRVRSNVHVHGSEVWYATLAEDGTLVTGTRDGTVRVWRNGRAKDVYKHPAVVSYIVASSKLDRAASVGGDGGLHLWRLSDGKSIAEVMGKRESDEYGALAMMPDGTILFSGTDLRLHFMDSRDGRTLRTSNHKPGRRQAIAIDRSGRRVATSDLYGWVVVVDVAPSAIEHVMSASADRGRPGLRSVAPRRKTTALSFSPDGRTLAAAGLDGVVRIFDLEQKRLRSSLAIHGAWINNVEHSQDGRVLLAGSADQTLTFTDAATGVVRLRLAFSHQVIASSWTSDGRRFLVSYGNLVESFEAPGDVFDADPDHLVEQMPPSSPPAAESVARPFTSRAMTDVGAVTANETAGTIVTGAHASPVAGALVEVLDGKTAAVLDTARSNDLGHYRISVPKEQHGVRITVGDKSRVIFGSVTNGGIADGIINEPTGQMAIWKFGAPVTVDPEKNILFGHVRYGRRDRYVDINDVGCARVVVEPEVPVYYQRTDWTVDAKLRHTHPGNAAFRVYNVEPDRPHVVRAEVGDAKVAYEIPPFPPGTAINIRIRFPAEKYPSNPTPADCFRLDVKRFD